MKITTKTLFVAVLATATMSALSADAKAGGKTLWFEGYGLYGATPFQGAWKSNPDTSGAVTPPADKATVKGESLTGFGGGLNVGLEFVQGLSGVLGIQLAPQSMSQQAIVKSGAIDVTRTTKTSYMATTFNLGIRPETKIGAVSIYGGGGLLFLMPMTATVDEQTVGETNAGKTKSLITTSKYNLGLGAYGEMGMKYHIGAVAIGLGLRVNIMSTSNNGKTRVTEDTQVNGTVVTTTSTIKDSYTSLEQTAVGLLDTATVKNNLATPDSILITNWQILLSVSYAMHL